MLIEEANEFQQELDISHHRGNDDASFPEKPRRALSAYNIFFHHQRQQILKERANLFSQQPKKSPHPQKIGFSGLARAVASRWKAIDAETRGLYEKLAAQEKHRYQQEIEAWKKLHSMSLREFIRSTSNLQANMSSVMQPMIQDFDFTRGNAVDVRNTQTRRKIKSKHHFSLSKLLPLAENSMTSDQTVPLKPHNSFTTSSLSNESMPRVALGRESFLNGSIPQVSQHAPVSRIPTTASLLDLAETLGPESI